MLTERVDQLRESIAMYEAQQSAQAEETIAAKQALSEAKDEIEVWTKLSYLPEQIFLVIADIMYVSDLVFSKQFLKDFDAMRL